MVCQFKEIWDQIDSKELFGEGITKKQGEQIVSALMKAEEERIECRELVAMKRCDKKAKVVENKEEGIPEPASAPLLAIEDGYEVSTE